MAAAPRTVRHRRGRHRLPLDRPGRARHEGRPRVAPWRALATIATHHIAGGDAAFFAEVQACYEHWDPATPSGLRLPTADEIPFDSQDLDGRGEFGPASFRRYEWELPYSTAQYLETLLTYSGHRALPPDARSGLLSCIAQLIDSRHGGYIRKRYLNELRVAYRR